MRRLEFSWLAFFASLLAVAVATQAAVYGLILWASRNSGRSAVDIIEPWACSCFPEADSLGECLVYGTVALSAGFVLFAWFGTMLARRIVNGRFDATVAACVTAFMLSAPLYAAFMAALMLVRGKPAGTLYVTKALVMFALVTAVQGLVYRAIARPRPAADQAG